MTITRVYNRFYVETDGGRLHILNAKALAWNLKHVFGINTTTIRQVVARLETEPSVVLEKRAAS